MASSFWFESYDDDKTWEGWREGKINLNQIDLLLCLSMKIWYVSNKNINQHVLVSHRRDIFSICTQEDWNCFEAKFTINLSINQPWINLAAVRARVGKIRNHIVIQCNSMFIQPTKKTNEFPKLLEYGTKS